MCLMVVWAILVSVSERLRPRIPWPPRRFPFLSYCASYALFFVSNTICGRRFPSPPFVFLPPPPPVISVLSTRLVLSAWCVTTVPRKSLVLGHYFNHPIQRLKLPGTLRRLAFGGIFDQPLDRVKWPEKLESVELGQSFWRDVAGVRWPRTLER